jgi:hypothetical protein
VFPCYFLSKEILLMVNHLGFIGFPSVASFPIIPGHVSHWYHYIIYCFIKYIDFYFILQGGLAYRRLAWGLAWLTGGWPGAWLGLQAVGGLGLGRSIWRAT